jgi:hypothetical protein
MAPFSTRMSFWRGTTVTFDSSQRVSAALYFKRLQSTGVSGSKVDGIIFPELRLEEGLGPFPLKETHL